MFKFGQFWFVLLAFLLGAPAGRAQPVPESTPEITLSPNSALTNINQLTVYVNAQTVSVKTVKLEGVLTWADPAGGTFILQDKTGAVRLDLQQPETPPSSGQWVSLEAKVILGNGRALLPKLLYLDNDGIHSLRERSLRRNLKAGRYSLRLDYFQGGAEDGLEVFWAGPHFPRQPIPASVLFHQVGATNWQPGLRVDYFEGDWNLLPDFGRLTPICSSTITSFSLLEPNRGTNFGLRFTGAITVPVSGDYRFYLSSDDGSRLSFDEPLWRLTAAGKLAFPAAQTITPGQLLEPGQIYRWSQVEGVVRFVGASEGGGRLDLTAGENHMEIDFASLDKRLLKLLPDAQVRIRGACDATRNVPGGDTARYLLVPGSGQLEIERLPLKTWQRYPSNSIASFSSDEQPLDVVHLVGLVRSVEPGKSLVLQDSTGSVEVDTASAVPESAGTGLEVLGWRPMASSNGCLEAVACQPAWQMSGGRTGLTPVERIRFMDPSDLQTKLRLKIHGVVTAVKNPWELTVNDGEYGISCWFDDPISNVNPGDDVEVEGLVLAGAFGPDLVNAQVKLVGRAPLPQPVRPIWNRLINGSLEQQWVEIEGVVQQIQDTLLTVEMNGGRIQVKLASGTPAELAALQDAIVRIRGTVVPIYNSQRQILGVNLWVNSPLDISVEQPASADPFAAPFKSVAQLTRFDPGSASPFYRVKVQGQILSAGPGEAYLVDGSNGLAFLPKAGQKLTPGDYAAVVGFPELGGAVPLLREALVQTNGHGALPPPRATTLEEMLVGRSDATRVSVEGVLINVTSGQTGESLELQVGPRIFTARLGAGNDSLQNIPPGSRLRLTGTGVGRGWRGRGAGFESVELLLDSADDVQILQLPPWWNARRIVALVVALIAVLALSLAWVYLLRRKVEQRTAELNLEMRQRKEIELKHAAEQERSRIARDLHDDLGSSLTEISLLASVGLPTLADEKSHPAERFGVIAGKARLLVNSLDVIVWAANPEGDEIQSFVDYLSGFAREFLAASGLVCRFKIPIEFAPLKVDGRIRHGLFLAVKETLNNAVRHAQASEVEFGFDVAENQIQITITDDGSGFDAGTIERGNGLNNLQERLADLGGSCSISSSIGSGTSVKIQIPLKSSA